ncbi:MAG: flagellar hook-length control protein FliK [Pseudomonadota bacterium]
MTAPGGAAVAVDRLPGVLSVQQPKWDRAFADQLTIMAGRGIETAELKLDPPTLGTVHVKLTLQGDQAQLLVQSANGAVRDLMESALPRLRELLGSEGLTLDSAQVADREQAQRQEREARERTQDEAPPLDDAAEEVSDTAAARAGNDADLTLGAGRLHIRV